MINAESSIVIDRSIEDVFDFVSDTTNEPKWHTDVLEAASISTDPVGVGTRFKWVMNFMGRRDAIMQVVRYEPNHLEELAAETDVLGLKPTITYLLEPALKGTRFTRRIAMSFTLGSPQADPRMGEQVQQSNTRFVENLKRILEGDS